MLTEISNLYDTFMAARAEEALEAVVFLGPRKWVWFAVGVVGVSLLLACVRIVRLVPKERTWQLAMIRNVASLFGKALLVLLLLVVFYAYFAYAGSDLVWSASNRRGFWSFVSDHGPWAIYGGGFGVLLGILAWSKIATQLEPIIASRLHDQTRKDKHKDRLTDARTVQRFLPSLAGKRIDYEAAFEYAKEKKSVFLGVNQTGKAVLIPKRKWDKSHVQICGPTGTGKGVQAVVVLTQALMHGDGVFVFDPKRDEWAASVLAQECEKAGVPFSYVDLRSDAPQVNIIGGATSDDLFELFVAGFGLEEKGEAADFYRIDDREAAYQLARAFEQNAELSLPELYDLAHEVLDDNLCENAKGFLARLKQLARLEVVNTRKGIDLTSVLEVGGCIYVVGSMRGQDIPALQKIFALRVIQAIENQVEPVRHASIFLDEIKYLLSAPTVNAFGTIRDKNCNLILTHQALQDFRDCGKDLSPDAVEGAIKTNTQIKWIYRTKDPETAEWAAKMSGKILVQKERRVIDRNEFLSELARSELMTDEIERYAVDENIIQHLPDGCALYIGGENAQLALTQPIPTVKRTFKVTPAEPVERKVVGSDLISSPAPEDPIAHETAGTGGRLL
ncbi:MAG: hypothetical protein B6D73_10765 [gamma proteobacterium symbiont of Stewartia floridana]|nr:MAG: hypothetical protein B6D73_10765 [gamma proteobacterium symbiont of Stewartia floridana]